MSIKFPSDEWLQALKDKLNSDEKYARIARKWEGDIMFNVEPGGPLTESMLLYTDLWHGECRAAFVVEESQRAGVKPAFVLSAPYENLARLLKGELDPMQAMITRKLRVQGSMAYMMRNVPVVLEFVRCCKAINTEFPE
ncbi:MAG: SCP2 sterol-binding domain-containing protein [Chloroflexi bacterium]|nr:SCP2 sterol-binding domain-containing protein [Chloroflexota bacterium]